MSTFGNVICLKKISKVFNIKAFVVIIIVIFFMMVFTGMFILPDDTFLDETYNLEIGKDFIS